MNAPETPSSVPAKPLHANELLKASSRNLRGDLAAEFADASKGGISDGSAQLIKFHGAYLQDDRDVRNQRAKQKLDRDWSFMIRVRLPGGVCTPAQWLAMDALADSHGVGNLRLTTRQTFQLHGVRKGAFAAVVQAMDRAGLDSKAACGDVNRTVMCNPNPHLSSLHADTLAFARAISERFLPRTAAYEEIWLGREKAEACPPDETRGSRPTDAPSSVEPIYGDTYLPRKFKIGIAIPPSNDIDAYSQDIAFVAIAGHDGRLQGFNLIVGGGMGMGHGKVETFPRLGDLVGYCDKADALVVAEEILKLQRDYGDRTNRAHARLKYTIEDRGIEWFKSELARRLGAPLAPAREFHLEGNGDRFGWVEDANGLHHLTLFIPQGRIADTPGQPLRTALREIARIHTGDLRLTANQNLIVASVPADRKATIEAIIRTHKLDACLDSSAQRLSSMACVALPTCGLALTEAERVLPDIVATVESILAAHGLDREAITLRVTGCPNGCARPYLAEVALVGRAPGKYNLYLGGGFSGQRLNKLYQQSLPIEDFAKVLDPLVARYARERLHGEHFGDFTIRAGIVAETTAGNDFHANTGPLGSRTQA